MLISFYIEYLSGQGASGPFFEDDLVIGGVTLKSQQMGLGKETAVCSKPFPFFHVCPNKVFFRSNSVHLLSATPLMSLEVLTESRPHIQV